MTGTLGGSLTARLVPGRARRDKGGMMSALLQPIRAVADFALPPRCAGCGALSGADHRFCAECWQSLHFLGPPWCAGCRTPFAYDRSAGALCGACLERPPPHDGTLAAVAYGPVARQVALRLKYAGRTGFAETAARMMARLVPDHAELLVPVPLDRWRLWGRGYNQAALIADALARLTGVPAGCDALVRTRASHGMRGLGGRQRRAAVKGAFAVADPARVAGRSVLVIDDVQATGATVAQCARVLRAAGAAQVGVMVWARVLDGAPA